MSHIYTNTIRDNYKFDYTGRLRFLLFFKDILYVITLPKWCFLEKRMVKEKGEHFFTPCEKVFLTPTFQGGMGQIMSKDVVDVISIVSPSGIETHFDLVSKE